MLCHRSCGTSDSITPVQQASAVGIIGKSINSFVYGGSFIFVWALAEKAPLCLTTYLTVDKPWAVDTCDSGMHSIYTLSVFVVPLLGVFASAIQSYCEEVYR